MIHMAVGTQVRSRFQIRQVSAIELGVGARKAPSCLFGSPSSAQYPDVHERSEILACVLGAGVLAQVAWRKHCKYTLAARLGALSSPSWWLVMRVQTAQQKARRFGAVRRISSRIHVSMYQRTNGSMDQWINYAR